MSKGLCLVGCHVICAVCHRTKKPIGRSAPLEWYGCDDDCEGYRSEIPPCDLWPGEKREDFGYPSNWRDLVAAKKKAGQA